MPRADPSSVQAVREREIESSHLPPFFSYSGPQRMGEACSHQKNNLPLLSVLLRYQPLAETPSQMTVWLFLGRQTCTHSRWGPTIDQTSESTQVWFCKPINSLGLLTRMEMKDYLQRWVTLSGVTPKVPPQHKWLLTKASSLEFPAQPAGSTSGRELLLPLQLLTVSVTLGRTHDLYNS